MKESVVGAAHLNREAREGLAEMESPKEVMGRAMQISDVRALQAGGTAGTKPRGSALLVCLRKSKDAGTTGVESERRSEG